MGETLAKDRLAMSQPFFGTAQLSLDVLHVKTTNILEFDALEQVPDSFLWIEFWCIRRQLFQVNTFGSPFCQEVFDGLTAMDGSTIPDHQQFTGDLAGQQLQKANDIRADVRMVLRLQNDLAFRGDTSHDRKMVTRQFDAQGGRLAHGRVSADRHRQQIKGGLIYKDDGPFFLLGLFFNAGHRSSFQVWIAASSRWVAECLGFCRLYLMWRRRRLQWAR